MGRCTASMNYAKFGDSYDFVKRGILQLLAGCGRWSVHPMFTDGNPENYAADYCHLLGVPAVTTRSFIQSGRNRNDWLAAAQNCRDHLLIDPDTGLPFDETGRRPDDERNAPAAFLYAGELARIVRKRPDRLTLVFDQSFHWRGGDGAIIRQLNGKLQWVAQQGLHGLAYNSHAKFLLVSTNPDVLLAARHRLEEFNFPGRRLIF